VGLRNRRFFACHICHKKGLSLTISQNRFATAPEFVFTGKYSCQPESGGTGSRMDAGAFII
jgi:hypothetical protein